MRRAKSWPIIRPPTSEPVTICVGAFHPPVRTHQATGSKNLFRATTRAGTVEGMQQEKVSTLLRQLRDFSTR